MIDEALAVVVGDGEQACACGRVVVGWMEANVVCAVVAYGSVLGGRGTGRIQCIRLGRE